MDYLTGAASMLILDSMYLSVVKPRWANMVKNIQGTEISMRYNSAAGVYLLMSFALYYFIVKQKRSVYDAALLGLVIYGVFDLTNYALFNKYSLFLGLLDMFWGAFLFGASAYITYVISRFFNKRK